VILVVLIEVLCVVWHTPLFAVGQKKRPETPSSDQEITHVRCQCRRLRFGVVRVVVSVYVPYWDRTIMKAAASYYSIRVSVNTFSML